MKEFIIEMHRTKSGTAWGEEKGELIRCKDCKYSKFVDWGMNDCTHPQGLKGIAYSNSYCDRAERREK